MSHQKQNNGFTLLELAIVLVIIGALLSYVFMPLRAQLETANIKKSRAKLNEIEEALYGFAIANNRLPCPAFPGTGGQENPNDPVNYCNNNAAIDGFIGFVPANTLGLKGEVNCDGLLVDPWGRPYYYSVTNAASGGSAIFVVTGGIASAVDPADPTITGATAASDAADIKVCNDLNVNCTGAGGVDSIDNAVAVIFTMGNRQRANSNDENENSGEGGTINSTCNLPSYSIGSDAQYYASQRIEINNQEFDDILIWISPNLLFNKLIQAGYTLQ